MQTDRENAHTPAGPAAGFGATTCPSCHGAIVAGMRFCRLCGYRLGEGVEEFAETRRLDPAAATAQRQAGPKTASDPFTPGGWAPVAPVAPTSSLMGGPGRKSKRLTSYCSAGRMSWVTWVVIVIAMLTALGVVSKKVRQGAAPAGAVESAPSSALGVEKARTGPEGGYLIGSVLPNTPVERAGLIGGDVITMFDGRPVKDASALRDLLGETPVGKTVEVTYTRDGETRTAALTTFSSQDLRRGTLPPRGSRGYLGVEVGRTATVPGQNLKGVKLDEVSENRPAYIAGLREGDIVVEFDGHPVRVEGDLSNRIRNAAPDSVVRVVVFRGAERLEIPVKMGRN